jgi:hypothetical protein
MAEEQLQTSYNLKDGDRIDVEFWTGPNATAEAEGGTAT